MAKRNHIHNKPVTVMPRPREARVVNCIVISLYGASFLIFLRPWMNESTLFFGVKLALLYFACIAAHFWLLYKRQRIYDSLSTLCGECIRFFEFPYFVINSLLLVTALVIAPLLLGLVPAHGGIAGIFGSKDLTMFVLFSGGAAFVAAAISGFDVYPVNIFRTREALGHLIEITRQLIKFSGQLLALIASAVLFAWTFKKAEFSLGIVYLTAYGVVGFALGGTAVLGARVTELLYLLADLEEASLSSAEPTVNKTGARQR